jgi:hypothetical protein
VSPILAPLISEVKGHNPGMTVYTIGDAAHQAEASDHNPDQWGFVCAGDFMIGSAFTATECEFLFDRITAMIRSGDKRPAYMIYNRRIVSSTVQPGIVRDYTGTDPHTNHGHVSVPHGSDPHPTDSWNIYQGDDIVTTQAEFNDFMDGWWNARMSPNAATNAARTYLRVAPWHQGTGSGGAGPTAFEVLFGEMRTSLAGLSGDQVNEAEIVSGLLAVLTPEAIATAIPDALAEEVAANLAARLAA